MRKKPADPEMIAGLNFDDLMRGVLREKGLLMPTTQEEVEQQEVDLQGVDIEVPASLEDPFSFFEKQPTVADPIPFPGWAQESESLESLRQVAREGRDIPEEVQRRMREDRKEAERAALRKTDGKTE